MFNFGKPGFDLGHYAGANSGPGTYREGDAMLQLGLKINQKYGAFITRRDGKDISFPVRSNLAKQAGCNTLISCHTNAPEAAKDIVVFYSQLHPSDKAMAEYIGKEISKAIGIPFREAKVRPSVTRPEHDYYGMIRIPVSLGIEHVFIVEHGSHWQFAIDLDKKIDALADCYGRILNLVPTQLSGVFEAIDTWSAAGVIGDPLGMKKDFETGTFRPDRYQAFLTKSAKYISKG